MSIKVTQRTLPCGCRLAYAYDSDATDNPRLRIPVSGAVQKDCRRHGDARGLMALYRIIGEDDARTIG